MKKLGVYIHIPFCIKKCFYCDFYSEPIGDPQFHRKYVKALIKEIIFYGENMGKEYQIDTIFIGGGTPSILEPIFIREILSALKKYFYVEKNAEITIECNPATLSEEKLQAYREEGINRISIGVQSLDDRLLLTLGRVHSSQDVFETVEQVRKAGFQNMNLDAMFGVPDQSISIWRETVKGILQLHPEHISFYSLELAENTLFYNLYKAGKLKITAISRDRKMYHFIIDEMRKAGLFQYEISNGAKPGFACRHNLKYWNLEEYLGLGASAHSYIDRTRFSNIADASCYVAAMERQDILGFSGAKSGLKKEEFKGANCVDAWRSNSFYDDITDYTFTALRKVEGIRLAEFEARFHSEFWDFFGEQRVRFNKYIAQGYAQDDGTTVRITEKGFDISNQIMTLFI